MMMKLRDFIDKDKLYWYGISCNPNAIELLRENPDKIKWDWLSLNPNAIELLRENPDKIKWDGLSKNCSIFTYDYKRMTDTISVYKEELIAAVFHPRRFERYLIEFGFDMNDL